MPLDHDVQRRYVRHVLLPEIGETGQQALVRARVTLGGEARATEVARTYLARSGIENLTLHLPLPEDSPQANPSLHIEIDATIVSALAGRAELEEAAVFLAGAFSAVETIKQVVGAGRPGALEQLPPLSRRA